MKHLPSPYDLSEHTIKEALDFIKIGSKSDYVYLNGFWYDLEKKKDVRRFREELDFITQEDK